jgi:hypothetical protein
MITEGEAMRAEEWVREAEEQGAKVLIGGRRSGAVLDPTVLTEVKPSMKVMCDEVFAPVVKRPERPVWMSSNRRGVSDIPPVLTPAERATANGTDPGPSVGPGTSGDAN